MTKESNFRKRLFSKQREEIQNNAKRRERIKELEEQLVAMRHIYDDNWVKVMLDKTPSVTGGWGTPSRTNDPVYVFLNCDKNPFVYINKMKKWDGLKLLAYKWTDSNEKYLQFLFESRQTMFSLMKADFPVKNFVKIMRKERLSGLLEKSETFIVGLIFFLIFVE
jgi:hypothetical protein